MTAIIPAHRNELPSRPSTLWVERVAFSRLWFRWRASRTAVNVNRPAEYDLPVRSMNPGQVNRFVELPVAFSAGYPCLATEQVHPLIHRQLRYGPGVEPLRQFR